MAASGGEWGVVGVSLRSSDTRDALQSQDWAYTAVSLTPQGDVPSVIEVLNDVLVAPEDHAAVLDAMAAQSVKIVSLTVTEKGYCQNQTTGTLDLDHPDIRYDLAHELPKSSVGYLVRGLQQRMVAGLEPFTVLTCDNLPQNGQLVRRLVVEMASLIDPALASWIERLGCFPSTMVDRITPATTAKDIARVTALTGKFDAAPVVHEPFAQWVMEDNFVEGVKPDFEAAGAALVSDVAAHENMKLRMLNGSHSALAYTGYLAGHETIADTVADPVFQPFLRAFWAEIIPTVEAPTGVDLASYADALLTRYENKNIRHQTSQIAMDGSQKLPQRLIGPLRDALDQRRPTPMLYISIAAWMRYVSGVDERGAPIDVKDPLAARLRDLSDASQSPQEQVCALLGVRDIFPDDLAPELLAPLCAVATDLWNHGVRTTISKTLRRYSRGTKKAAGSTSGTSRDTFN